MERLEYEKDLANIAKQISEECYHHFDADDPSERSLCMIGFGTIMKSFSLGCCGGSFCKKLLYKMDLDKSNLPLLPRAQN